LQLVSLLKLYSIPGIGSIRMKNLITTFGSPKMVLDAPLYRLLRIPGIDRITAQSIKNGIEQNVVKYQLDYIKKHDIKVISFWDELYPNRLKMIPDPPAVLFVQGQLDVLNQSAIGVVGTRKPSHYGKLMTEKLCREIVINGFTIISGLARGIDTIAHKSVLNLGGYTIAILGTGLDNIYPPENKDIARLILEKGALISEYPMRTLPDGGNFPKRNRIISGLSLGVLIAEAGVKSGALITASHALEQNREVFALPGPINSEQSMGTNQLIKEGAKLVQDTNDILNELQGQLSMKRKVQNRTLPKLNEAEIKIFDLLSDKPSHIDQLAQLCEKGTAEVLSVLLNLELFGIVKQLSGKLFVRI
jgi:DNA processing protein